MQDVTEKQLSDFLVGILKKEFHITMRDFIERVRLSSLLSAYDLSPSETRPNEVMFEQKCRNIISHGKIHLPSHVRYEKETFYWT